MAYKDFFIYSDRQSLLGSSTMEYRVEKLLSPKLLKQSIMECKDELELKGAESIIINFDKLFSVIEYIEQVNYQNLHFVYEEVIVKSLNMIASYLSICGIIEELPSHLRHQYTNIIKMAVYVFVEFSLSFNKKLQTDYKLLFIETKGRNKIQDIILKHTSEYGWNWESKLCVGLKAINSIISYNITELYDPPYIDHTFVLYLSSYCYTLLENPSIAFVRTKDLCNSIMEILKILITTYDHATKFKNKVAVLLKLYEHLAIPLAKTVLEIVQSQNNRCSLVKLIVKEIAHVSSLVGTKLSGNKEITSGKSYCAFLVEIAKHSPKLLLPNIDYLLPCLGSDPYTMRICVLSVLKELIVQVLNHNQLDKHERKTRDRYLLIIRDHSFDTNAYVRSKSLQLFIDIIKEDGLPKHMYKIILNCTQKKLQDKSSYVTKSAIQLIKTLIKLNPYSCYFTESKLQDMLKEENHALKTAEQVLNHKINSGVNVDADWLSIEPSLKLFLEDFFKNNSMDSLGKPKIFKDIELSEVLMKINSYIFYHKFKVALQCILGGRETFNDEPLFKLQDEDNLSEQLFLLLKNIWYSKNTVTSMASSNMEAYEQMTVEEINLKISSTESKISYLQECSDYLQTIKKSLTTISNLMFAKTTTESLEAIDFFTTAYQFGVPNTQVGIDGMLLLVYSPDTNIKEAIMNSYKTIYLEFEEKKSSTTKAVTILTKLVKLVKSLDEIHRKAFKILFCEWIVNNTLDTDCVMLLWSWFTESVTVPYEDRVIASLLLSWIASVKSSIAISNLGSLIKYGLCDNYELFIYTCQILEHIDGQDDFKRFSEEHPLVKQVLKVTQKCFGECDVLKFNDVAANAIYIIYKLSTKPDVTCKKLLFEMCYYMKKKKKEDNKDDTSEQKKGNIQTNDDVFAKIIFVVGQIAIEESLHLENYVASELIRRVKVKYDIKKSKSNKQSSDNIIHDYEAAEIERINDKIIICNEELLNEPGILSHFTNHVLNACYSDNLDLKRSGIISLMKFMIVSTSFCKKNLPTYLNLIENSENFDIAIDLICGFGWLIFKHPNLLDPCTDKLFGRLNDKRSNVRFSALMIIIDLIRQEMIKVRGQIAGVAKLLVDEDEKINRITKHFFRKLSEKGNTLYNVISDIVSILSNPEDIIPENDFKEIIKFLIPFIDKERQIESLVDKFCIRLKGSNNETQAYYISYCLIIIKHTDKSLTKLSDNLMSYADTLKIPKVYDNFNKLISANFKMSKQTTKDILDELTSKIDNVVQDEGFIPISQKTPGKRLALVKKKTPKSTILDELPSKIDNVVQDEGFIPISQKTPGKRLASVKKKTPKSTILDELPSKIENVQDEGFIPLSQKTPGKRLTSVKKKIPKSTIKDEKKTLPVATKRSARIRTKVKRRLMVIDSEEEESDMTGVDNIQEILHVRKKPESSSDSDNFDVFKRSTRSSNRTNKKK